METTITLAFVAGLISLLVWAGNHDAANKAERVLEYSKIHNCQHVAFAGRYAEIKVFKCNNGLIIDKDM